MELDDIPEIEDLQHSLRTAGLELSLERSKHSVQVVAKDEEIRKLRLSQLLLRDQIDDLHEQLEEEQARSDGLEVELDDALMQLDQLKADAELSQNQIRTQTREVANLKVRRAITNSAELKAMENVTSDSNKILSEKLALTREMSSLRPEVEHLRAQVESNQGLLAEKLSLQRQLTTLQVEVENEKRASARAMAKQGKKSQQDEELQNEVDELRKELAKEKKDRLKLDAALTKAEKATEKAQAELEDQQQATERAQAKLDRANKKYASKDSERDEQRNAELEELREQLEQEKRARQRAEKASKKGSDRDAELEELRQELEQEKRERQKAEKTSKKSSPPNDPQADALRKDLEEQKRENRMAEKEYQRTLAEIQGRNNVLDDKLSQFRDKLRATKDKLKEKETELLKAQSALPVRATTDVACKAAKNARKRMAASVEPEATNLGTPGDGFPAKKAKRAASVAIGDQSTFSLTPFLNRTANVAPASPITEEPEEEEQVPESEATPTAPPKKTIKKVSQRKPKPLAPSASNKANAKPPPRKKTAIPTLEKVTEEASELSEDKESSENALVIIPLKDADDGATKEKTLVPKIKPRKSLMSFANFMEEPAAEKKKKRKLGGSSNSGLGKTLFDDDEDVRPVKPTAGKSIFAARALGKSVLGKGPSRPISGGYNMMSEENFTFSPLKKDRRNASILK
ncbi:uncharacterized protein BDR25DRAFT_348191 [Lindgomyces ingoldianus]|uniref:Uncharacterized protein n=1 Tax=Lindgomyces ingoldianus TaxID=673940 RepID=A0ACB6RGM5_9PLEO|nr:uncharacterized protein BDR25DRAFT_348191 [Lindgomyces ingoldianus]KAF2477880.1 hypothetical protein BDR25DRAFT_348191 [Lindgomyces ingoldianus]